jgi:hypothetical protein
MRLRNSAKKNYGEFYYNHAGIFMCRADLSNDQQMNYLLAWFQHWSDLQREDFVAVLAETVSSKHDHQQINGLLNGISDLNCR